MPDRRTYADRADYLKRAVTKRRRVIRRKLVEYKGGSCVICGYSKCIDALDLHHRNSIEKDFGISSKGLTRAWETVKSEADKCELVCANCHREIHANVLQPDWATNQGNTR